MRISAGSQILFCVLIVLVLLPQPMRAEESPAEKSRLLVHLLDYLAVDYGGAVQNGIVVSDPEYKEQQEFIRNAMDLSRTLPGVRDSAEISSLVSDLDKLIQSKSDEVQVAAAARAAQRKIIELTGLTVAPAVWPDVSAGQQIFSSTCVKCHGQEGRGDGPASADLKTKPANFQNPKTMEQMTPFQVFNTIRLGVPGTPMASFQNYSDQDTWNLAFFILSMRYQKLQLPELSANFEKARAALKMTPDKLLSELSTSSDSSVVANLQGTEDEKTAQLAALRLHTFVSNAQASLEFARFNIAGAVEDYVAGRFDPASQKALRAYVEGVEPVELRLRASDPQAVLNLEQRMGLVRMSISGRKPNDEVRLAAQNALESLAQASGLLKSAAPTPWLTFILVFGILLREGFEAVLLIVALLGVIRVSGATRAARWVHGGWLAAVALGVGAWFLSGWLVNVSGLGREMTEGITGVITVGVLLYVGFWLHSRTEITRWKTFIDVQVKSAVEERNLIQLALISFLAAFREALETVLFLRAIWLEGGALTKTSLQLGVLSSLAAILVMGWLILKFSTKLPIRTLFNASSIVMIVLSVILAGKALHSFQEVDLVPIHLSPLAVRWDWLGLYPTQETLLGQSFILTLSVFLWWVGKRAPAGRT